MFDYASIVGLLSTATCTAYYASIRAQMWRKQNMYKGDGVETQATLTTQSAMALPIVASLSLLVLFFLFKFISSFVVIYITATSIVATAFCLDQPLRLLCSRITATTTAKVDIFGALISVMITAAWLVTGSWVLNDILGVSLCVTMVSLVKLPNLKVATLCLFALFFYDIFWVFYSERLFGKNVMVEVATQAAHNPLRQVKVNLRDTKSHVSKKEYSGSQAKTGKAM